MGKVVTLPFEGTPASKARARTPRTTAPVRSAINLDCLGKLAVLNVQLGEYAELQGLPEGQHPEVTLNGVRDAITAGQASGRWEDLLTEGRTFLSPSVSTSASPA